MDLTSYRTLGRSSLAVSPMALGTMTFGASRWGSDEAASRAVFDAYVEAGGNLVDTADVYAGGESERMLGRFIGERGLRDRMVIATKAGFSRMAGNPHAGGNGAKNIRAALDASLKRLGTDFVDLYLVHVWDAVTPAEELLQTLASLVRTGTIRHYGLSNVPAWYLAKLATLAAAHALPAPVAVQVQYSLLDRAVENEFVPAARDLGLGLMPWSPLGGGLLTGKYHRGAANALRADALAATDRLGGANPFGDTLFTERNWRIVDALRRVADAAGQPPARVALAWTLRRPGVGALVLGARRPEQLVENLAALDLALDAAQSRALDEASAPDPVYPYPVFAPAVNRMVFGGATVDGWRG